MLTARGEETDRIVGLEMGADDYLAKPFNPRELLARIKSVLRRRASLPDNLEPESVSSFRFAGWTLDVATRNLTAPDGVVVPLSGTEFRLLRIFLAHPNRVLTRDQLIDLMISREAGPFDRAIDVQVSRLRQRLREDAREPRDHQDRARRRLRAGSAGRGGLMRILPRSLFGRLVLVLLGGLVVAQLVSFAIHMHERGEALSQASGMQAAQRIADIVKLLDSLAPSERRRVVQVFSAPPLTISLDRSPLGSSGGDAGDSARAALFGAMLRRFLGDGRPTVVTVRSAASACLRSVRQAGFQGARRGTAPG